MNEQHKTSHPKTLAVALATVAMLLGPNAFAQVAADPTEIGGGRKAYVLMIIDSSASMEYTTKGDNEFPFTDELFINVAGTHPDFDVESRATWRPGLEIDAGAKRALGACWVYHPDTGCGDYGRPSWRPSPLAAWPIATPPADWAPSAPFYDAESSMRGLSQSILGLSYNTGWRLRNDQQPRHVTVKEILTGSMILLPNDADAYSYNPNFYNSAMFGPGCWFIPRQRDASTQPLSDQTYCAGEAAFEGIPDYDQPIPHFQEVFDVQQANGVLDTLSTTALFAVAAFDGYREDINWGGFNTEVNDSMAGASPDDTRGIRASVNEGTAECDGLGTLSDPCYNLGIWQVIGPSTLNVPASILPELAAYTQVAINDTGFLRDETGDDFTLFTDQKKSQDNAFLGVTFSKSFKKYARDVVLGKQPIARATPIAAAIHDVYQFMAHGQYGDGGNGDLEDPINEDVFAECRPKHVVILTDGSPSPERNSGTDITDASSDTLNEAFGYDPTRYKYDTAELEIFALTSDVNDAVPPASTADPADLNKYDPRVHILGLNLQAQDDDAIAKMARMAISGNSCASALVPELVPIGYSVADGSGGADPGTCAAGTGCLVPQTPYVLAHTGGSSYNWIHPKDENLVYPCNDFPALILDNNDPEKLSAALSSFLSALVESSGLTSRTRLVVTNRLDDVSIGGGGQYRVYSGVRLGGGSAWWKGVLNRNTKRCDGIATDELSLDQEIGQLVNLPADSRRVWTAIPHETIWNFPIGGVPLTPMPVADPDYPMAYRLQTVGDDEFKDTYLTSDATGEAMIVGTRVPFEASFIDDAFPAGVPPFNDYNVFDEGDFTDVVNVFRARIPERISETRGGNLPNIGLETQDRVLGGILNSNPVIVGPPEMDLPIASYRDFRARYADRTTMLYVSSIDGLLHAIHLGALDERINKRAPSLANAARGADTIGSAVEQREAWAYMPWMVHRDLSSFRERQAYLVDGTPVAKDVRLCSQTPANNTNVQACESACQGSCTQVAGADQWRTVLVQGRGEAGAGYYAMDITRPGGLQYDATGVRGIQNPDPILLWEFDREWEAAQLAHFQSVEPARISSSVAPDSSFWDVAECNNDLNEFWRSPMLGLSVSEAEIATVIINGQQRPVAVFGGGQLDVNHGGCGGFASGMAIYVVDLQTGSLIRRFTHYADAAEESFMSGAGTYFVGSPALFDSSTGSIATRGFIGDSQGRLFKIDFLDPDPLNWEVSLFFDPTDSAAYPAIAGRFTDAGNTGALEFGPAGFRPAVTLNARREVMVVYGLGEVGDVVTNSQAQAVIALTEDRDDISVARPAWVQFLGPQEKLTAAPIIFDSSVYFATYAIPADVCLPGHARIWGVRLVDADDTRIDDVDGVFDTNPAFAGTPPAGIQVDPTTDDIKWFGPEDPTLVRGLTVTLGEICSTAAIGTDNPVFTTGDRPQPQLIAQTSGPVASDLTNRDQVANPVGANALDRVVLDIKPPESQTIPLSWSLVY